MRYRMRQLINEPRWSAMFRTENSKVVGCSPKFQHAMGRHIDELVELAKQTGAELHVLDDAGKWVRIVQMRRNST